MCSLSRLASFSRLSCFGLRTITYCNLPLKRVKLPRKNNVPILSESNVVLDSTNVRLSSSRLQIVTVRNVRDFYTGALNFKCTSIIGELNDRKIFVGMLNFKTDENSLREYFSKYGVVDSATVARSMTNRSKGYGFVHFKHPESVKRVLADKHFLNGREIKVNAGTDSQFTAIYIPEIPADVGKDQLKNYFSQFGNVRAVDFIKDKETKKMSHGYVKFYSQEDAVKALESPLHQIDGHQIETQRSRSRISNIVSAKKVYVKGLSFTTSIEKVKAYFEKYGSIAGVDLNVFHDKQIGQRKIIAFVSFDEPAVAERVVNEDNHSVDGEEISVRLATDSRITKKHSLKVCVEDFSSSVAHQDLVQYFEKFGPLDNVYMVNKSLLPFGVQEAIVQFKFSRAVDTVMAFKDHMINGEPITVRQLGWRPTHSYTKKHS